MLHIGHQREALDIELEGKQLTQRDSFAYLGGAVCGGGPADLKKTKGQGHEHLCDTGMSRFECVSGLSV